MYFIFWDYFNIAIQLQAAGNPCLHLVPCSYSFLLWKHKENVQKRCSRPPASESDLSQGVLYLQWLQTSLSSSQISFRYGSVKWKTCHLLCAEVYQRIGVSAFLRFPFNTTGFPLSHLQWIWLSIRPMELYCFEEQSPYCDNGHILLNYIFSHIELKKNNNNSVS